MKNWIESQQALVLVLKHGPDLVQEYHSHLLDNVYNNVEWNEETGQPLEFDQWLVEYNDFWNDQIAWENSSEFQDEMQRLSEKD